MSYEWRPLRVLVDDDYADAAAVLALMLRLDGHEVRTAGDGRSALREVAADPPDVVFCDIGLPDMDGYEVARRVRETIGPGRTALVALTGRGSDEDRARSRAAGFDHHLVKPVDPQEVEDMLRMVGRSR